MRLRSALAAAAGATGAVVGHRLLRARAGPLGEPLSGVERTYRWRGMDVAYTTAGDPDDRELVLVHGVHAAASSYEFEPVFDLLAEHFRVIAVDLPGFGRSDRPPLVYSAGLYAEFLADFVDDVADEPIVVASSLAGAFATDAADETDVERLVLICPTADTGPARPWLRTLFRAPVVGTVLFDLLASKPSIRYYLRREGYYDPASVDAAEVDYAWRSAHQRGARYAPASFVASTLDPDPDPDPDFDLATELAALETRTTLVWGRDAERVPLREGRALAEAADLDLVVIDYATQLPHAEHPEAFVEYLRVELAPAGGE